MSCLPVQEIRPTSKLCSTIQSHANIDEFPPRNDLVSRLIRDDQDLWKEVLGNPFCVNMKTASADDRAVLEGFKWYMTVLILIPGLLDSWLRHYYTAKLPLLCQTDHV